MKRIAHFFFALILVVTTTLSFALDIEIATGDINGSYSRYIKEMAEVCNNDAYTFKIRTTKGSPFNLDLILANEVPGGIAQLDVGDLYRNTKDLSNIKILIPLFPEQVHFITRAGITKKQLASVKGIDIKIGGWTPGASENPVRTVSDIVGMKIAAIGGSAYTARMMMHPNVGNLLITLDDTPNSNKEIVDGILSGIYDVGILVTAYPAGVLDEYKATQNKLQLLPIDDALMGRISKFYPMKDSLSYQLMRNSVNVTTVQVMSALLVPNYTKGPYADAFSYMRDCIQGNAEMMASTPRKHLAWSYIASRKGVVPSSWSIWERSTTTLPPPKKK